MDYRKLGNTGLQVSRLALGCMTFGEPERGSHPWTLPEAESRPLIRQAIESGINFFDTANIYSDGSSEEILGRALRDFARRDEIVLATKVAGRMRSGPNGAGLSRKSIFHEIDASLRRLGVDYVDLYQVHRWDDGTPIDETMEALHDVVKSGKARYIGASSMPAWKFSKAQHIARMNGFTPFASMQNHYNLLYREEEREMLPLCWDQGVGVIPWSPLARGRLAREPDAKTERLTTDTYGRRLYEASETADRSVIDAVGRIARGRGISRAQVALAWVLENPAVSAPIIGASEPRHLAEAISALDLRLSGEEKTGLEAPYVPHAVAGLDF